MAFTCVICQIAFKDAKIQREHYKSNWHQYNVKRKVAEWPSLSAEEFQRRFTESQQKDDEKLLSLYCTACKKTFLSSKTFDNHLPSKKHLLLSANLGIEKSVREPSIKVKHDLEDLDDLETESESDGDEWATVISPDNPISKNNCLFCDHHSTSMMKNLKHMSEKHSFFIPMVECLSNLKGLLFYLGEKICNGYVCIWCDEKYQFASIEAVRAHMLDKGHTKMNSSTEASLEYLEFYDYSIPFEEDCQVVENFDKNEDDENVSMVLPSGEIIYHRSLAKYVLGQNSARMLKLPRESNKVQKLIKQYRVLGFNATDSEAIKRKSKDVRYLQHLQSKFSVKLQLKTNKFQPHFRQQVNF